jgi:predicted nucleic acid-binding protein
MTSMTALPCPLQAAAHSPATSLVEALAVPEVDRGDRHDDGYRQLTDAYLLVLANRRKGVLATFDRGLRSLAGDTLDSTLEVVPTR